MKVKLSIVTFLLAVVLVLVGWWTLIYSPIFGEKVISDKLILRPYSDTFKFWQNLTNKLYSSYYLFNVTNPRQVEQGAQPVLQEVGPFVYQRIIQKKNAKFLQNNTKILYLEQIHFQFVPEQSVRNVNNIQVTTLNVPMVVFYQYLANMSPIMRRLLSLYLKSFKPQLFIKATANQLLFSGAFSYPSCFRPRNIPDDPFCRFSYFGIKNKSIGAYYTINSGTTDQAMLNTIHKFEGSSYLPYWNTRQCNRISNSFNGQLFPPLRKLSGGYESFRFFQPDLCRVLNMTRYQTVTSRYHSLIMEQYRFAPESFQNSTQYPPNKCYRTTKYNLKRSIVKVAEKQLRVLLQKHGIKVNDNLDSISKKIQSINGSNFSKLLDNIMKQLSSKEYYDLGDENDSYQEKPNGVLDISPCNNGYPVYLSYPHFYDADPYYRKHLRGMNPDPEKHETYLNVEPITGIPFDLVFRFQVNIDLTQVKLVGYSQMRQLMFPVLWQSTEIHSGETYGQKLWQYIRKPTLIGYAIGIGIMLLALALFLVSICIWWWTDYRWLVSVSKSQPKPNESTSLYEPTL